MSALANLIADHYTLDELISKDLMYRLIDEKRYAGISVPKIMEYVAASLHQAKVILEKNFKGSDTYFEKHGDGDEVKFAEGYRDANRIVWTIGNMNSKTGKNLILFLNDSFSDKVYHVFIPYDVWSKHLYGSQLKLNSLPYSVNGFWYNHVVKIYK